jgi:hypothetical protein
MIMVTHDKELAYVPRRIEITNGLLSPRRLFDVPPQRNAVPELVSVK